MADIRLKDFSAKPATVSDDLIYGADSSDSFNEIKFTIDQMFTSYGPALVSIKSLTTTKDQMLYTTGPNSYTTGVLTPYARELLAATDQTAAQDVLGLSGSGGVFQPYSIPLTSIANLTTAANQILYTTASNSYAAMASGNNSVLATSNVGVPSLTQTLPAVVQNNISALGSQSQTLQMNTHWISGVKDPALPQDAATRKYVLDSVAAVSGDFLLKTGGTLSGPLHMSNQFITDVLDPVNAQDASTKAYSDKFLPLTAGLTSLMTGDINMNNHKLVNVTDPTSAQDVSTKAYSDLFLPLSAGLTKLMTDFLNMNGHQIKNVANPSSNQDAATKASVDALLQGYLSKSLGGIMAGAIDMGNNQINNMADPSSTLDAVNLSYLNTRLGSYLLRSGGIMTGPINMSGKAITSLLDPINPQDAATRNYVDLVATGFNVKAACYAASAAALTVTYSNGASGIGATLTNAGAQATFTLDGVTPPVNSRVLIKNQASTLQNGIYVVNNVGSGVANWVLVRAADYDQPSEIEAGDLVIINNGASYAGTSFAETADVSIVGTDPVLFSQFTFSATAVLLKANNLSDVASTTTAFNNISPSTTKGDLIGFSTQNIRLPVGSDGQLLQASSGATTGLAWSTATYPVSTTANQLLYSSASNTVAGLSTLAGGILVTDNTSVPQFLTNPAAAGKLLQSGNSAIPAWSSTSYPSTNAINTLLYASAANVMSALATANSGVLVTSATGVPSLLAGGATGQVLQASTSGTPAWSTPTFPTSSGAAGAVLISNGTNYLASTSLWPNTVGTSGKILISDGTSNVYSTPTFPNAAGTSGNVLTSDGTNFISAPPTGGTSSGGLSAINYFLMGA